MSAEKDKQSKQSAAAPRPLSPRERRERDLRDLRRRLPYPHRSHRPAFRQGEVLQK